MVEKWTANDILRKPYELSSPGSIMFVVILLCSNAAAFPRAM